MTEKNKSIKNLSEIITISDNFHRSVNLSKDWNRESSLDSYILTPTAHELTTQFVEETQKNNGNRAWTITGPYGTGKSAFALFLADLFCNKEPRHKASLKLRKNLGFDNKPFIPILLVSDRKPLEFQLIDGIANAFKNIDPDFSKKTKKLLKKELPDGEKISDVFTDAAKIATENNYGGIITIVDEFGKFLEYAAAKPEERDLLFLQTIAETADRSKNPILFFTMLHMGFSDYLSSQDELHRQEWEKIQGRFKDIAFQLPMEQLLLLVKTAIQGDLSKKWQSEIDNIIHSDGFKVLHDKFPAEKILPDCAPLHPVTALILWPLFRSKLAQNERSLFAFLSSKEPFGFKDHLQQTQSNEVNFYDIPQLFDYVQNALALGAFRGDQGRKWALIERSIGRIPGNAPKASIPVIKSIGLISSYGSQIGLDASKSVLQTALSYPDSEINKALDYLEDKSIIVFRKYKNAYSLWEGSDVDLESAYEEAKRNIKNEELSQRLEKHVDLRPFVARAHYIESGTLRYFDVRLAPPYLEEIQRIFEDEETESDGTIIYVLGNEYEHLKKSFSDLTKGPGTEQLNLIAMPQSFTRLEEKLIELETWKWVNNHVPELKGDKVARQEVKSRISHAQEKVEKITGEVLGLAGHSFRPELSTWIQNGETHSISSAQEFQKWLSALCDNVFEDAPDFHNELLNRQSLSSSATGSQRNLIEAMLINSQQERLGIDGTPAEASMYESMLKAGGFHQENDGSWFFTKPNENWIAAWEKIDRFLKETRNQRKILTDLFETLKKPTLGLREGPLPVLFIAYYLVHQDEIAFYEDGVYVPNVQIETLERMLSRPETFEIQTYALDNEQKEVLKALTQTTLGESNDIDAKSELLPIVKSLVEQAAKLPAYTIKTKKLTPPEAIEVRDALLEATSPLDLLFKDLPEIFDLKLDSPQNIKIFSEKIHECMSALNRSYPALLDNIENGIRTTFDLPGGPTVAAVASLRKQAKVLEDYALEGDLQVFVRRAARLNNQEDWREVLGSVIQGGLPPAQWNDKDADAFQINLKQLAGSFYRLQELVAEHETSKSERILRLGLLHPNFGERRAVVSVNKEIEQEVEVLSLKIDEILSKKVSGNGNEHKIKLAALAEVAEPLLELHENGAES